LDSLYILLYSDRDMDLLGLLKNAITQGIGSLSGRASAFFNRPKKSAAPLADRLLADAFRLGQLPSPTEREEERAIFVVERLKSLSLRYYIDQGGNILVVLHPIPHGPEHHEPLLVFTRLGSDRWNSLESLGKLELQYAQGAGLADVLGPAALLSLAEGYAAGRYSWEREVYLYFSALHFDDPGSDTFLSFTSRPDRKLAAAIGVRGFSLGSLSSHSLGLYRVELSLSQDEGTEREAESRSAARSGEGNEVVGALTNLALSLQGLEGAAAGMEGIRLYIRRIEASTAYGRTPVEGVLELDLESSDKDMLDRTLEKIRAKAETGGGLKSSVRILSSIPPGNPSISEDLTAALLDAMKELKIKAEEEAGADPASFLSAMGIPALSVGIAKGREGLNRDTVEIASIEKGRLLLERFISRLAGQGLSAGSAGLWIRELNRGS
jgi:hypothetical protein